MIAPHDDGNVGLGITSPISPLHIKSDAHTYITLDKPSVSYESGITFRTGGASRWYAFTDNDGTDDFKIESARESDGSPRIQLPAANNNLLLGLSGGNVGIGTTNPGERLHVNGVIRVSPFTNGQSSPYLNAGASLRLINGNIYNPNGAAISTIGFGGMYNPSGGQAFDGLAVLIGHTNRLHH